MCGFFFFLESVAMICVIQKDLAFRRMECVFVRKLSKLNFAHLAVSLPEMTGFADLGEGVLFNCMWTL